MVMVPSFLVEVSSSYWCFVVAAYRKGFVVESKLFFVSTDFATSNLFCPLEFRSSVHAGVAEKSPPRATRAQIRTRGGTNRRVFRNHLEIVAKQKYISTTDESTAHSLPGYNTSSEKRGCMPVSPWITASRPSTIRKLMNNLRAGQTTKVRRTKGSASFQRRLKSFHKLTCPRPNMARSCPVSNSTS